MKDRKEDRGIISTASCYSVAESVARVRAVLAAKNIAVFVVIDQRREAEQVGLELRPTTLIVFGDPRAGTPLMEAFPTLAIDLPLKALVWQPIDGTVWVACNSPSYLMERHGLEQEPFAAAVDLVLSAVE